MDKVWISSISIITISIIFSLRKTDTFNSYKIFYLFSLFFFGIAPLVHYENNASFFGARPLLKNEYFILNLIILIIIILFNWLYYYFINRHQQKPVFFLKKKNINDSYFLLIAILFLTNKILLFRDFSYDALFLRDNNNLLINFGRYTSYFIGLIFYVLPLVLLLHLLLFWKRSWNILRIITVSLLLFSSFPTALSRTNFGILVTPMTFLIFPWLYRRNNFVFLFIVGFIYLFPFLNQFRDISSLKQLKFKANLEMFSTAHFDSYYNFGLMFDVPLQWGKQLLGVLLFFVPRDFWPGKPVGSGAFMAEFHNMTFTNISANYFAEGYINFGFMGIVLFLAVLCYLLAKLDYFGALSEKSNPPLFVLYLQLIFSVFYLLRGDLMSSFATMVSIVLLNVFIVALLYRIHPNYEKT